MKFIFQLNYYKIDNIFCKNYIEIKNIFNKEINKINI
jgi:hypothetical protein